MESSLLSRVFNTSILKKERIDWIDYLRGIAIILVVYHHVRVGVERSQIPVPSFLVDVNMIFYSFRMPLFFILSGIFITRWIGKASFSTLVSKKFNLLIYPYFIWTFFQISLQILLGEFTNSQRGWFDYLYILYHPRFLDQFWYLPALFNATLAFLVIKQKLKLTNFQHIALAVILYFLSPFMQASSMVSDWMEFYIFLALGHFTSELFFRPRTQELLSKPAVLLAILPFFLVAQLYYLAFNIGGKTLKFDSEAMHWSYLGRALNQAQFFFIAAVGCLTMFIFAFCLQKWKKLPFLKVIGYHSLYIYVMHVMVIGFVRLTLIHLLGIDHALVLLPVCIAAGVLIPMAFYNLAVKEGPCWFLFSHRRPKNIPAPVNTSAIPAPVSAVPTLTLYKPGTES
jgi:fucose 4-O-acetylase-like acetyltransferase